MADRPLNNLKLPRVNPLRGDSMSSFVDKFNEAMAIIENSGGGPRGFRGRHGEPGCQGIPGPPGMAGIVESYYLRSAIGVDCKEDTTANVEDHILNKITDFTFLLSNLELTEGGLISREIGESGITSERVSSYLKDYKVKIYNSTDSGIGKHIHLLNSKAVQSNIEFLCKSGYAITLDWNGINQEYLRFVAQRNPSITGHLLGLDFQSDVFQIRKDVGYQRLLIDPSVNETDYSQRWTLDELTADRTVTHPDRSGYNAVWQDTLEHSESWEIVSAVDLELIFSEYYKGQRVTRTNESFWNFVDISSFVRYKRMNNWVLVDFHLGLGRVPSHDAFNLRALQFKVGKSIVGCKTDGWHPATIMSDESNVVDDPTDTILDHCAFKLSPADHTVGGDTILFSLRFRAPDHGPYYNSSESLDGYWITGQVWATFETEECAAVEIVVHEGCPEFEIATGEDLNNCPPIPTTFAEPTVSYHSGECGPAPEFTPVIQVANGCEPANGNAMFPAAIFNTIFNVGIDTSITDCMLPSGSDIFKIYANKPRGWFDIIEIGKYCGPVPPVHYYAGNFLVVNIPDEFSCPVPLFGIPYAIKDGYEYFFPTVDKHSPYPVGTDQYYDWLRQKRQIDDPDGNQRITLEDYFREL